MFPSDFLSHPDNLKVRQARAKRRRGGVGTVSVSTTRFHFTQWPLDIDGVLRFVVSFPSSVFSRAWIATLTGSSSKCDVLLEAKPDTLLQETV